MKHRAFNFGAGPAMLPLPILQEAQEELLNWRGRGLSILELGHRTPDFMQLLEETEASLRALLAIPKSYQVLFVGGPARLQFSMIPMNLLKQGQKAAYLVSGVWSDMALKEAVRLKQAYCAASSESKQFRAVPSFEEIQIEEDTDYLYYTPNETVNGTRYTSPPLKAGLPLIADMTSCLLSEAINIQDFALIFAGAQKNIANAGLTLVIMRDDLAERISDANLPTLMDYRTYIQHKSLYATPPTFNCYLAQKMFKWIEQAGGVAAMYKNNCIKSERLYDYIDRSSFYHCPIEKSSRSLVNICFQSSDAEMDQRFVVKAAEAGLLALQGHRLVGGLRASLYNAMPLEGVDKLLEFMDNFSGKFQA